MSRRSRPRRTSAREERLVSVQVSSLCAGKLRLRYTIS